VLISFNNRPVTEAIPAFEELIVPLSEQIMGDAERSVRFRDSIRGIRSTAGARDFLRLLTPFSVKEQGARHVCIL
jgi:hypothetical protein